MLLVTTDVICDDQCEVYVELQGIIKDSGLCAAGAGGEPEWSCTGGAVHRAQGQRDVLVPPLPVPHQAGV